tara:strand:- start:127 stop:474 length:348 start_codon:yes stop_codon:yes gene_type:complete
MTIHPREIKGARGSWFSQAPGVVEKMPIMWRYEYNGKTHELETGWIQRGLKENSSKHLSFQNFFKENTEKEIHIALADPEDKNKHPHVIKEYIGVFFVKVLAYEPEIKLLFIKQI